ncbi:AfsR/SARP family transcriptional regulator [Paractinoplanes brasiliensis]|uniref:DNA-binding SARP family transcriptional activator n=1 Tax=Paractinoplanes brasiliensis TaxID=52695 RepID=A0A4R6K2V7_9ACTN|nr:AfsR/SARP family transcriptional regulator [Actinoplanes brasiliensis]TDO42006.1 DNA-binding SARP family transcriptional activator [Actinoplanes brasiliensis]GID33117.1 hypothetical protein Abr02nite_81000 [Actinoplanes brasiliensis]
MRFKILGPLEILGDDGPAPVSSPRVRALAAVLLLEGRRRVKTEALIDMLWDTPPPSAPANLRTYVTALRRVLRRSGPGEGSPLTTLRGSAPGQSSSYLLSVPPEDVDVTDFQRLAALGAAEMRQGRTGRAVTLLGAALRHWRGAAGEDVSGSRSLTSRLEALNEQRMGVREQFIAARIACGESGAVVRELRDVVAAHPLRERGWQYLVTALYLTGDVSSALDAYRQAEATFRGELGIDISPELQRLHLAILRRDEPLSSVDPTRRADSAFPPQTGAVLDRVRGSLPRTTPGPIGELS